MSIRIKNNGSAIIIALITITVFYSDFLEYELLSSKKS